VGVVLLFLIVLVTLIYYAQGKSDSSVPKEVFANSESSCSHWALLTA
jgi:Na+-transporting methylmalonyl-CoA/oxaloacetate decarboxylase gamma subunit